MREANQGLSLEVEGIQALLQERSETVEAIRDGAVDAFVMNHGDGEEVFVLDVANHPYRQFVEQMNEGAITLSQEGIILYANRYFAELLKAPLGQIMGASLENFLTKKEFLQKVLEEKSAGSLEVELLASNGATLPARMSYGPLRTGKSTWICVIIMDLTEEKQQQVLLQESQCLAAVGRTAAVLCHEIANPLSGISTSVQMMQGQIRDLEVGQEFRDHLRLLKTEIDRLSSLLHEFRSLSQPAHLNLVPTDIASLLTEGLRFIPAEVMENGIRIEQRFSTDLPLLSLDSEKMKQVFLNLYKNAIEAMPSGGKLTINARLEGSNVEIEIRDTGVGIPEGMDIFDFFTTGKPGGTGLGLAVVRHLVATHRGKITYVSERGKGTSFFLSFPIDI